MSYVEKSLVEIDYVINKSKTSQIKKKPYGFFKFWLDTYYNDFL